MRFKKILRSPTSTNRNPNARSLLETTSAVYVSLVSVKKLTDYAAFDKNVDRNPRRLLLIDLCWCREGESNPQDPKVGGF